MKKKLIFTGIICTIMMVAITMIINANSSFKPIEPSGSLNGLPVYYNHATYALDTSTPEKAYGASKYVFIAKIDDILRTEYVNPVEIEVGIGKFDIVYDPITVYSATVVKNIKGELTTSEPIEITQNGGISKDGKSYIFMEDSSLLKIGDYYIILTGANEDGGSLDVTNPQRIISFGNNLDLIKNVQQGKISTSMKEDKETAKLVDTIENFINAAEKEEKPVTLFENAAKVPVLDNVSKYDVNYKK
ncbi:MAG: hypothetical protein WC189_03690 [Bacilli bacterium]